MSGFDWIIAAVFLVSILVGIMRGFIKEALSIVSWVVAVWLAISFCVEAGDFIGQYIEIPNLKFREWAGFALVFIVTLFLFALLSYAIIKLLVHGPIKGTDRVLGIGFGAVRAAAIIVAVLIVTRGFGMENSDWWKNSNHLSKFLPVADYVENLLPKDLQRDTKTGETLQDKVIKGQFESLQTQATDST